LGFTLFSLPDQSALAAARWIFRSTCFMASFTCSRTVLMWNHCVVPTDV